MREPQGRRERFRKARTAIPGLVAAALAVTVSCDSGGYTPDPPPSTAAGLTTSHSQAVIGQTIQVSWWATDYGSSTEEIPCGIVVRLADDLVSPLMPVDCDGGNMDLWLNAPSSSTEANIRLSVLNRDGSRWVYEDAQVSLTNQPGPANDPNRRIAWVQQLGSPDYEDAVSSAYAPNGVVAVTGYSDGDLFGQNRGQTDMINVLLDSTGQLIRSSQTGGPDTDRGRSVTYADGGFVVGSDSWRDEEAGTVSTLALHDLAADGGEQSRLQFTVPDLVVIDGAVRDSQGNYIVTYGAFNQDSGYFQAKLRKLDSEGQELWSDSEGTYADVSFSKLFLDDQDNLYIGGATNQDLAGPMGPPGTADYFMRKYSPDGVQLWTRQFGAPGYDTFGGMSMHGDFASVAGTYYDENTSQNYINVALYDLDGRQEWIKNFAEDTFTSVTAVQMTESMIIVGGHTRSGMQGSPTGLLDIYVMALDMAGNELWRVQAGAPSAYTYLNDITWDEQGALYLVGNTSGRLMGETNEGDFDLFVMKLWYSPIR